MKAEMITATAPGKEMWKLPSKKLVLSFDKKGDTFTLSDYRSSEPK